jgi:uncharacterized alkaline shock family protein YloU
VSPRVKRREMGEAIRFEGRVEVAEEVIRCIAALAAVEVEGLEGSVVEVFGGHSKGVEVQWENDSVRIALRIAACYGHPLPELGRRIQERVKHDVEKLTGLRVSTVDVHVQRLRLPHEQKEEVS